MGKVTILPIASADSPIYKQGLKIGARVTAAPKKPEIPAYDLQNLPFDPAKRAGELSLALTEGKRKDSAKKK